MSESCQKQAFSTSAKDNDHDKADTHGFQLVPEIDDDLNRSMQHVVVVFNQVESTCRYLQP